MRSLLDSILGRLLTKTVGDILTDGARKEEDVLFNGRNLRTQRVQAPIAHIDAIDEYTSLVCIIDTVDQFRECTFARACLTNNGDRLAWFSMERDILEYEGASVTK